jgi:hypothetical protein
MLSKLLLLELGLVFGAVVSGPYWRAALFFVTVQVGGWGRPLVCRLAGPLARCSDCTRFTEPEAP